MGERAAPFVDAIKAKRAHLRSRIRWGQRDVSIHVHRVHRCGVGVRVRRDGACADHSRPRRRLWIRRRLGDDDRRFVRTEQQRRRERNDVVHRRKVRQRTCVQRHQRAGHGAECGVAAAHYGHDARGVGFPHDGADRMARDHRQERRRLLPHGVDGQRQSSRRRRHLDQRQQERVRHRGPAGQHVDAPCDDVRRNGSAPLRERRAGSEPRANCATGAHHGNSANRRGRLCRRELRRPHRRGARLQPRAERGRDPGRHGRRYRYAATAGPRHRRAERAGYPDHDGFGLDPGHPLLGRGDRQRRRHRLSRGALCGRRLFHVCPNRNADRHEFRRYGTYGGYELQLPRPRDRRRGQSRRLLERRVGHHDDAGYDAAERTVCAVGHRGERDTDQSELGGGDRQRRRDGLSGGALPGRRLHDVRADLHADRHDVQQHGTDRQHELQLSRACRRRRRKPQRVLECRFRNHARRARYDGPDRTDRPFCQGRGRHAGGPRLDRLDGQRRRHELPDPSLPGLHNLHDVRAGRHLDGHELQQYRTHAFHDLPFPRTRRRWRGQRERQLEHGERDHDSGARYDAAERARRARRRRHEPEPDQRELDCGYRQRGCNRLSARALLRQRLQRVRPDRRAERNQLQRHRAHRLDELQLSRARRRWCRKPRQLLLGCLGDNAGTRSHPADRAHGFHRHRHQREPGEPELDRFHRQRGRDRLYPAALPGRRVQRVDDDRHTHRHDLQRHRPLGDHHLPLLGARHRCRRQPESLVEHRHCHYAHPGYERPGRSVWIRRRSGDSDPRRLQPEQHRRGKQHDLDHGQVRTRSCSTAPIRRSRLPTPRRYA